LGHRAVFFSMVYRVTPFLSLGLKFLLLVHFRFLFFPPFSLFITWSTGHIYSPFFLPIPDPPQTQQLFGSLKRLFVPPPPALLPLGMVPSFPPAAFPLLMASPLYFNLPDLWPHEFCKTLVPSFPFFSLFHLSPPSFPRFFSVPLIWSGHFCALRPSCFSPRF